MGLNLPSTAMPVADLKEMYRAVAGLSPAARIRMFYTGKEMMDNTAIGNYNVQNEAVLQAMIIGA